MQRSNLHMPTMSCVPLKIGRLMTLLQIPVIAGDSMSIKASIVARLTPLRRQLVIDPLTDIYAFFVPHRHAYPNWIDFLYGGVDENETLATFTGGPHFLNHIGARVQPNGVVPAHILSGYNQIWNRNFRVPSDETTADGFGILPDLYQGDGVQWAEYGARCAYPQNAWNTGIINQVEDNDKQVPITGGVLDVVALEQIRARYGSEQQQNFFARASNRYNDNLKAKFGTGGVNIDADERPALLAHTSDYLSGYDVDGTGDTSLGQYQGKGIAKFSLGVPRKHFLEHGSIFILGLIRYPLMVYGEAHYLNRIPNGSYKQIACDPRINAAEPPQNPTDIIALQLGNATVDFKEVIPYANYTRTMPTAYIHDDFAQQQGFPFVANGNFGGSYKNLHYVNPDLYNGVFQTPNQLAHAQMYSNFDISCSRVAPSALSSVFSGAK